MWPVQSGSRAALPSQLPACFAGLPAQKGCVEHACFGVSSPSSPSGRRGTVFPGTPVFGVTRLSLGPPPPCTPPVCPEGLGARALCAARPNRALFSSPRAEALSPRINSLLSAGSAVIFLNTRKRWQLNPNWTIHCFLLLVPQWRMWGGICRWRRLVGPTASPPSRIWALCSCK